MKEKEEKMSDTIKLSLVMIVRNEERCLKRCLISAKSYVDEIVIVDTGSTDQTKEIAKEFGAKIFDFEWCNDFSKARNYGLEQSTGAWNLILDADEYITKLDKSILMTFMENPNKLGVIKVVNVLDQDGETNYSKVFLARLLPKGVRYIRSIHEQPDTILPSVKLPIEVEHDGYLNEVVKVKRNLLLLQEQEKKSPDDSYILYQLAYTLYLDKEYKKADEYFKRFYKLAPPESEYRKAGIISYIENNTFLKRFEEGHKLIEREEIHLQDSSEFYFVCAAFYREYVLDDVKKNIQFLPYVEQCYLECLSIGETDKYDGAIGTGSYLAAYNLGVWYEVTKRYEKALECYNKAIEWQYEKAKERKTEVAAMLSHKEQ